MVTGTTRPETALPGRLPDLGAPIAGAGVIVLEDHPTPEGYEEAVRALARMRTGSDLSTVTDHLVTGGRCWTMTALRRVAETGGHAVPESPAWIDELVTDLQQLADRVRT